MSRRTVLVGMAVVLPAAGLLTWALVSADTSSPGAPPAVLGSGGTPAARATAACRVVERVQGFVKDNEDRDTVFDHLEVATKEMALAAQQDPAWIPLQSGVLSLDRGLRTNDGPSAELGIAIARDQCRRAGVFLPGAVKPQASP